jgi:drug/metabolite transporter (DMT)-like permease
MIKYKGYYFKKDRKMDTLQENKRNIFQNPIFVSVAAIFCCALWGSASPFIKLGYAASRPEGNVPSTLLYAGIRFALAGVITVIAYSIARGKFLYPKKENYGRVLTVSAFQTMLQYLFFYLGLSLTSGVKGTMLSGSNAFFTILVAALIFRVEKFTPKKIISCLLGLIGIVIVNFIGLELNVNWGDAFVIFSNIAYGISSVLIKKFSKYEDPVVISGYQFAIGGSVMIIIGLIFGGKVEFNSVQSVAIILYLAALSAIAYSLWGILLKNNPVSKVSIFSFMIPVFGVLLSKLMLPEESVINPVNLILALVLICGGIFLLNFQRNLKAK